MKKPLYLWWGSILPRENLFMSLEKALVGRTHPHFLAAKVQSLIQMEAAKGCSCEFSPYPVPLEPFYEAISIGEIGSDSQALRPSSETTKKTGGIITMKIWISPDQPFNWLKSELFIKGLVSQKSETAFLIEGNARNIEIKFSVSRDDLPYLATAFRSQFDCCELTIMCDTKISRHATKDWEKAHFLDFYPLPPYSHLFTQPSEMKISPFEAVFTALSEIAPPATGFYQILFQGTVNNWHENINILLDFEYAIKLMAGLPMAQKLPFQSPSGELRGMAYDTEAKAHNDKPIFTAAMRIGFVGHDPGDETPIRRLSVVANLFQHGGRPLQSLTQDDYRGILSDEAIREMFVDGLVHRPGFILNSSELSGMVHLPSPGLFKNKRTPVILLETLPPRNEALFHGTPIGISSYAGIDQTVCIPPEVRCRSTHLIARHGMGKSTLLEHMVLHDIGAGAGVAVLDPHGDLIYRLLHLIPEDLIDKTIYLFPGDQEWVPLWNPVQAIPGQDVSRTADDIVAAIKKIVESWGDRLETLLRHALYALLKVPGSSLLDVSNLLRKKSKESIRLIDLIEQVIDNETSKTFWREDFSKYNNQDLSPPQHKLSKLLMSGTVSLMLSQPENRINFREIMDSGKILLVDLSGIGSEVRELLGSFILNLLHITALTRSDIPIERRKQYHIYCDEAHRFLKSSVEDLIAETRKFRVSLTLAHQYLKQFDRDTRDAILTAGSTLIFNVDMNDARYLVKDLQELVRPEDLAVFEVGEAIARIGTDIVKIRTSQPMDLPTKNYKNEIIENSHQQYYRPTREIEEMLKSRAKHGYLPIIEGRYAMSNDASDDDAEEFIYDEFD